MNPGHFDSLYPCDSSSDAVLRCGGHMEHLKDCFKITGVINSSLEPDEVLELIMTSLRAVLKAEASSLRLADPHDQGLPSGTDQWREKNRIGPHGKE
jgi:hypothetical protein